MLPNQALKMIREQYATMCFQLAYRIIRNKKDAEKCVNDMLPTVWDTIPPLNPEKPVPYLAALTSRTAINQYKRMHNQKRGSTQFSSALEELVEIIPSSENAVTTSLSVISGDNEPTCSAEQLALADVSAFMQTNFTIDSRDIIEISPSGRIPNQIAAKIFF